MADSNVTEKEENLESDLRAVIELSNKDTVEGTVFSKSWVLGLLVRLVEGVQDGDRVLRDEEFPVCQTSCETTSLAEKGAEKCNSDSPNEKETRGRKILTEEGQSVDSIKSVPQQDNVLEEGLENDLCKVWDASMNAGVSLFLHENGGVELLMGSVARSKSSRLSEICIGIIGNMMCHPQICHEAMESTSFVSNILSLLNNPDPCVLTETIRLIMTCLSHEKEQKLLLDTLKSESSVLSDITFILKSSVNEDLLRILSTFLDRLLDLDDSLCSKWSCQSFVSALCEAIEQCSRSSALDICYTLMLSLQSLSTSKEGVQALVSCDPATNCIVSFLDSATLQNQEEWSGQNTSSRGLMACLSLCHCMLENSKDEHMISLIRGSNVEVFLQRLACLNPESREQSSLNGSKSASEWQTAEENADYLVADGIRNLARDILSLIIDQS